MIKAELGVLGRGKGWGGYCYCIFRFLLHIRRRGGEVDVRRKERQHRSEACIEKHDSGPSWRRAAFLHLKNYLTKDQRINY